MLIAWIAVLPYFELRNVHIGSIEIGGFTSLVCLAVIVGFAVVVWRAPRVGLSRCEAGGLAAWTFFWGFVGSHLFEVIAYSPQLLCDDPLELVKIRGGMSSFGGISGGMVAAFLLMRLSGKSPDQIWRFFDCLGFAFPFGWIFGRAGCAGAHDHLGVLSSHWLAVRFPEGPRFDLGLLELIYTLVIATGFFLMRNRPLPPGIFPGLFLATYGPVRFALDTLRTGDVRYLGWTPGQYMSVLATAGGLAMLYVVVRRAGQQAEG